MNNYLIKSYHEVFEDFFETGEGKHINSYNQQREISAISLEEAVIKYYETELCYTYVRENICDDEENENILIDSKTVDDDNFEISSNEIKFQEWKKGNYKLYSNYITVEIYELVQIRTDKFFEKTT